MRPTASTISIHALLAESDNTSIAGRITSNDFYPRSPCGERQPSRTRKLTNMMISIHALLAESDCGGHIIKARGKHFYPRSPCGERLLCTMQIVIIIVFLSTLSLRRATDKITYQRQIDQFLSTLSLRRATSSKTDDRHKTPISIHALLAESDVKVSKNFMDRKNFYPRSPCGERPTDMTQRRVKLGFLSTLSLRRATLCRAIGLSV